MNNADLQKAVFESFKDNGWHKGETSEKIMRIQKTKMILSKLVGGKKGLSVLDIGIGDGDIIQCIEGDHNLYGMDLATNRSDALERIKVLSCDFEKDKFPFADGEMDIVLCNEVIEHLLNTDHLLNEANRVLKTGGLFVLSFPNINQPISWLMGMLLDYPPKYCSRYKSVHVRDWTLRIIKKVLKNYNFEVNLVKGTYVWPFTVTSILGSIAPRFCDDVIVVAKKMSDSKEDSRLVVWDTNEI